MWVFEGTAFYGTGNDATAAEQFDNGTTTDLREYLEDKVGLIRLARPVPAAIATPIAIAPSLPRTNAERDEAVDLYSYGDRNPNCSQKDVIREDINEIPLAKNSNDVPFHWGSMVGVTAHGFRICSGDNAAIAVRQKTGQLVGALLISAFGGVITDTNVWLLPPMVLDLEQEIDAFSAGKRVRL